MGQTYETYYKQHNGDDWDIYYFRTSAAVVGETSARKFISDKIYVNGVAFNLTNPSGSGAKASVTITGANIATGVTYQEGEQHYINAGSTVAEALKTLDFYLTAFNESYPSADKILTTDNYSTTLGSVYQAKNTGLSALATLAAGSNVGFVKKTGENTFALDNSSYVPTSRKINNQQLNQDLNFYATNLYMSSDEFADTISARIIALESRVDNATQAFSIKVSTSEPSYKVPSGYLNDQFRKFDDTVILDPRNNNKLLGTNGEILLSSLEVGDDLYIENADYPDRWVSSKSTTSITFTKRIEARQSWDSITGKPSSVAAMITSLGWTDLSIASGVIKIGANTITPLTTVTLPSSTPTLSWGETSTLVTISNGAGNSYQVKVKMPSQPSYTDYHVSSVASTKTKLYLVGATTQSTGTSGVEGKSNVNCYVGTDNCLYSNGRKTSTQKVTTGNTAPNNAQAGDLWFDTTVPSA